MADLERELLQRCRGDGKSGQQLRVPVALQDLSRRRRRLETEPLASHALDLGIGRGVRADCARELSDTHPLEGTIETRPVAVELERPPGQLEPERGRFGMNPMRSSDLERCAMLLSQIDHCREGPFE